MASSFEIVVSRTGIGELTRISQFHALEYVLVENDIGALTLVLPDIYPPTLFMLDTILEVYRTLDGVTSLEGGTIWFVRETSYTLTGGGEWVLKLVAFDAKELLKRRIVQNFAGSAQASKSDFADDMMREIVSEQLGPSATDDVHGVRKIIGVEADTSSASVVRKAFAWRNVLAVVQEIANAGSSTQTDRLVFNIVKQSGAMNDLEFRVRKNIWGIDHGQDSGQAIVFSPDNGALADVQITVNGREEITAGTAGGSGEGILRATANFSAVVGLRRSYWNRREGFVDARNSRTLADLASEIYAYTTEHFALQEFLGKVQQTGDLRYGVHYRWGDKVVAAAHSLAFDTIIKTVHVKADAGGEDIDITLNREAILQ